MSNTVLYAVLKQRELNGVVNPIMDPHVLRIFFHHEDALKYFNSLEVLYKDAMGTVTPSLRTLTRSNNIWVQADECDNHFDPETWIHDDYVVVCNDNKLMMVTKDYESVSPINHDVVVLVVVCFGHSNDVPEENKWHII